MDEGHKGHSTEDRKWKRIREVIAKNGFTFEYSATFGQAIDATKKEDFEDYSKSILFDYSYKYFFADGYGKDFHVLNLDSDKFNDSLTDVIMLANAMSFFEQKDLYQNNYEQYREYNISDPLWIFIGHKVQEDTSDLLRLIRFFCKLLGNRKWALETIDSIISGNSGLLDRKGKDVFARRVPERNYIWLRYQKYNPTHILNGILKQVFNISDVSRVSSLYLIELVNSSGEIALRVGDSEFFGIINIGNKSDFLRMLKDNGEVVIEQDRFRTSVFNEIENNRYKINILIGAKKFIEGWNSWRVSSLGLLNIGKKEGPQIIQLFGRGVRLKGKKFRLKRSRYLPSPHPEFIQILETLNVFGIKASYMDVFKYAMQKEEIKTLETVIPTKTVDPFPPELFIIKTSKGIADFKQEKPLVLKLNTDLQTRIDLSPRIDIIDSRNQRSGFDKKLLNVTLRYISDEIVDLINWDFVYYSILQFKKDKGWSNLLVKKEVLVQIILNKSYELICEESQLKVNRFRDIEKVNDLAVLILKKYIDIFYIHERKKWEQDHMLLYRIGNEDQVINKEYLIKVSETDENVIEEIEAMKRSKSIYDFEKTDFIHNANFDRHLYSPLFVDNDLTTIVPVGLNMGEAEFVSDLKAYCKSHKLDCEIYLLRNLSHGQGIGFFDTVKFYPDFIMWIKIGNIQIISFIDPKGLIFVRDLEDQKLKLYEYLQDDVTKKINNPYVFLNAFIISDTPLLTFAKSHSSRDLLTISEMEKRHVLFQYLRENVKNEDYIDRMFEIIFNDI